MNVDGATGAGHSVTGAGGVGATSGIDPNPPAAEPVKKIRVLLVDDESTVRDIIKFGAETLRPDKFEFVEAKNLAEALEILETDKNFGLIISDKDMPQKDDGLILAKERPQDIKFILISANAHKIADETITTLNIARKIKKPVPMKDLFNIIDAVLTEGVSENAASVAARAKEFQPQDHTILAVSENDDGLRQAWEYGLSSYRYNVIETNHSEALGILRSGQPVSAILSNNGFKTKNAGLDLRRAIVEDEAFSSIPFLLCSNDPTLESRADELATLGIRLVYGKDTINLGKIEAMIRSVITPP